jgi:hypothetical protein
MNPLSIKLTQDHQELDALLRCLAQDAEAPVPGALQATWALFEDKLCRHMEAEERFLLPLLEASDPAEVARIRLEHARIRNLLTELGVNIDLHTARQANVVELIELLHAHARHENGVLYRLAGDRASASVEQSIARLLRHGVAVAASLVSQAADRRRTDERDRAR